MHTPMPAPPVAPCFAFSIPRPFVQDRAVGPLLPSLVRAASPFSGLRSALHRTFFQVAVHEIG